MSDRKIKKESLTALAASTWEFGEEPPKTIMRPSGGPKAGYSSSNLRKKFSGRAASKFDPDGTSSQVALCEPFFCDSLDALGATDCRSGSRPSRSRCPEQAKVLLKVTINDYTLRSTIDNRGGQQYIVVNAEARWNAAVKGADVIPIFAGEKR